jgi:hypothetical protein
MQTEYQPNTPMARSDYARSTPQIALSPSAQQIAQIHAQHVSLEQAVAAGLARIAQAKTSARGCWSASGREYFTFIAVDEANALASLLRIRWGRQLDIPGRPVPPSISSIKEALELHRTIAVAEIEEIEAEARYRGATNAASLERMFGQWNDASNRVTKLKRMLGP